jgi:DNA-binding NarL/FixJ family response regulator
MNQDLARRAKAWDDWKQRSGKFEDVDDFVPWAGRTIEFRGTAVIILASPDLHLRVTEILQAIQPLSSANGQPKPTVSQVTPLTRRELEVLDLIAKGRRNREIARDLYVTLDTVKKHTGHILRKLGAASRTHAVARARELGLIP